MGTDSPTLSYPKIPLQGWSSFVSLRPRYTIRNKGWQSRGPETVLQLFWVGSQGVPVRLCNQVQAMSPAWSQAERPWEQPAAGWPGCPLWAWGGAPGSHIHWGDTGLTPAWYSHTTTCILGCHPQQPCSPSACCWPCPYGPTHGCSGHYLLWTVHSGLTWSVDCRHGDNTKWIREECHEKGQEGQTKSTLKMLSMKHSRSPGEAVVYIKAKWDEEGSDDSMIQEGDTWSMFYPGSLHLTWLDQTV